MSEENVGEEAIPGEGFPREPIDHPIIEEIIVEKYLTFEEASRCLNTLGKDESGMRYAYLMITALDRKLTDISTILNFKHVLFIDVSGNYLNLESLQTLVEMPFLILLRAQRNRIDSASVLPMPYLQVLDLSRNQILETADIEQPMLEYLELNFNQLYTALFNSEKLPLLKQLEMRGNYLPDLGGNFPTTVENLYLAENRISKIVEDDLAKLVNLKILHLRENYLRKLDGFTSVLQNLQYLNLRKNKINKFRQFRKLNCLPSLEVLIVINNPVAGDSEEQGGEGDEEDEAAEGEEEEKDKSRIPLLVLLPNLKRINKSFVTFEERSKANAVKVEKYDAIMAEESSDEDDETGMATSTEPTTGFTTGDELDA